MSKLYITDLDGTLLNSKGFLSEYTKENIQSLIDNDVNITFATARSLFTSGVVLDYIDFNLPIIVSNGGALYYPYTKQFIHINSIDYKICNRLYELSNKLDIQPFVLSIHENKEILQYKKIQNQSQYNFLKNRLNYNDKRQVQVNEFVNKGEIINLIYLDTLDKLKELKAIIQKEYSELLYELYERTSDKGIYYLNVRSIESNKGNMIKYLAKHLNINTEDITVFGDEVNDIEMFKVAGKRVAVSNAKNKLKEYADFITKSNEDDAVVEYIINDIKHKKKVY